MYSLLVSHQVEDQAKSAVDISKSRFLEYTSDAISNQLESLSTEAIDCMKSWPCILMQEGRGQEVAHVVRITAIQVDAGDIKLTIAPLSSSIFSSTTPYGSSAPSSISNSSSSTAITGLSRTETFFPFLVKRALRSTLLLLLDSRTNSCQHPLGES